jgi:hypothetical protein
MILKWILEATRMVEAMPTEQVEVKRNMRMREVVHFVFATIRANGHLPTIQLVMMSRPIPLSVFPFGFIFVAWRIMKTFSWHTRQTMAIPGQLSRNMLGDKGLAMGNFIKRVLT